MSVTSIPKKPITGEKAFTTWLNLAFETGEKIWFKFSHNRFFTGTVNCAGVFPIWSTKGDGTSRNRAKEQKDGYGYLSKLAARVDGGVFYIPGKPTDFPLKEYCLASDDIGGEMDDGTAQEQWERIELLVQLSGLTPGYIIGSGGKSAHPHWKLAVTIPIAKRTFFARLMAIALLGDPAVTNPHQPMRVPGFYRKEKGKEQTLEFHSEARYSPEKFEQGMQRCFAALGFTWRNIEEFSQDRWQEVRQVLSGKLPRAEKEVAIRHLLALPESELPENVVRRELEKKRNARRSVGSIGTANTLIDAVKQASEKLGSDAFDWTGHNWQWTGNKARGCCPWHESTTGTAGWVAPLQNGNGWGFACPTCTDNKQLNAFTYWWHLKNGINAQYPKGKEWVAAAKEFCQSAGISIPELPKTEWAGYQETPPPVCDGYHWWDNIGYWLGRFTKKIQKLATGFAPKEELTARTYKLSNDLLYIPGELPSFEECQAIGSPVIVYGDGQRLICWSEMAAKGYEILLDTSMPGLGKSHDAGLATPAQLGVDQLFCVLNEHRNPTTHTVEATYTDLPVRHNGLITDPTKKTPLGYFHVRWPKPGEETNVTSNCFRAELNYALSQKGYQFDVNQEAKINPVCRTCHLSANCAGKDVDGQITPRIAGASFRRDRRDALAAPKVRAHLNSVPDFGYFKKLKEAIDVEYQAIFAHLQQMNLATNSKKTFDELRAEAEKQLQERLPSIAAASKTHKVACLVDEASRQLQSNDITEIGLTEFDTACMEVASKLPEDWEVLKPIILPLRAFLAGDIPQEGDNYYGWNDQAVREIVGALPAELNEVIKRIEKATKPNLEEILQQPDTVDFDSVSKKDRKGGSVFRASTAYRRQGYRDIQDAVANLPTRWLVPFLQVLLGGATSSNTDIVPWTGTEPGDNTDVLQGAFRIKNRKLTISVRNTHQLTVLAQMDFLVLMDATTDRETMAMKLGYVSGDQIAVCKQATVPTKNLKIVQITGMGLLGKQRSENLNKRREAVKSALKQRHPDLGVIDHLKCKRDETEGHWFVDNRGSNDFLGCSAILSFGAPFMDIGTLQTEYTTLTGDCNVTRKNPAFQSYVDNCLRAEITQWVGRLRANRRPNEQLTCYIAVDAETVNLNFLAQHYPGADITVVRAMDICPEAASNVESHFNDIAASFVDLSRSGGEITTQAIADKIGLSKGRISQLATQAFGNFERLKTCLTLLVKGLYSKIKQPKKGSPPDIEPDLLWLAQQYFPLLLAESNDNSDLLTEVAQTMQVYGAKSFLLICQTMTTDAIVEYIRRLGTLLPPLAQEQIYEQLIEISI